MAGDSSFYEKGFKAKEPIPNFKEGGDSPQGVDKAPGYLEGHNSSPRGKKYNYEAEGGGSKGPAAR